MWQNLIFSKKFRESILNLVVIFTFFPVQILLVNATEINSRPLSPELPNSPLSPLARRQVGIFQLIYNPTPSYPELEKALRKSRLFESIVNDLNQSRLVLPVNLSIILDECKEVNAFYQPANKSITVCYEFILGAKRDFEKVAKYGEQEATKSALYATIFAFYHELGHALIDILQLPTVGEEEGAVDEFAAIILLNGNDSGDAEDVRTEVVLNGAIWFGSQPQGPFWDEHPPGDKRFFNLVCLIYGSNPQVYQPVMKSIFEVLVNNNNENLEQLQRRGELCQKEYPKKFDSWRKLLIPHFARGQGGWGKGSSFYPNRPSAPVNNNQNGGRVW